MKQHELLLTVGGIVEGVDVEGQSRGRFLEGVDELIDEHLLQPSQRRDVDGVFESRMRGLTGEFGVERSCRDEAEHGVVAKQIVVILIFVVGEDSEDARPRHLPKRMPGEACVPVIVECISELLRKTPASHQIREWAAARHRMSTERQTSQR